MVADTSCVACCGWMWTQGSMLFQCNACVRLRTWTVLSLCHTILFLGALGSGPCMQKLESSLAMQPRLCILARGVQTQHSMSTLQQSLPNAHTMSATLQRSSVAYHFPFSFTCPTLKKSFLPLYMMLSICVKVEHGLKYRLPACCKKLASRAAL